jgi:hypothetical protein
MSQEFGINITNTINASLTTGAVPNLAPGPVSFRDLRAFPARDEDSAVQAIALKLRVQKTVAGTLLFNK